MSVLLKLQRVSAGYSGYPVISDINLEVFHSEYLHLRGPNGSGKSTVFSVISGALPHSGGDIFWLGQNISSYDIEQRFGLGIGHLRQRQNTFDQLTIRTMWRVCHRGDQRSFRSRFDWLIDLWPDVRSALDMPIGLLSGGIRQVAALGCVVINPRALLLLDEPTGGLAPAFAQKVLNGIDRIREQDACAVVLIDHNHALISERRLDRIGSMENGRLVRVEPVNDDTQCYGQSAAGFSSRAENT